MTAGIAPTAATAPSRTIHRPSRGAIGASSRSDRHRRNTAVLIVRSPACSESSAATGERASSVLEALRHLAAAFGELEHHLPVQPGVHRRRAVERAGIAELLG